MVSDKVTEERLNHYLNLTKMAREKAILFQKKEAQSHNNLLYYYGWLMIMPVMQSTSWTQVTMFALLVQLIMHMRG